MKLTEAEMRMVFQIESTNQNAALNEIYMTWCYAPNPATKDTAEGLLDKLRPLSDQECMDLIRKVQAEYRLPEKARTIGEGETFFDVMNRLIARNKAVTADMEAVLAELESEIEPFRAPKDHE